MDLKSNFLRKLKIRILKSDFKKCRVPQIIENWKDLLIPALINLCVVCILFQPQLFNVFLYLFIIFI